MYIFLLILIVGADRLYGDIEMMIGYKPNFLFKYMWKFVTPVFVVVSPFLLVVRYTLSNTTKKELKDQLVRD